MEELLYDLPGIGVVGLLKNWEEEIIQKRKKFALLTYRENLEDIVEMLESLEYYKKYFVPTLFFTLTFTFAFGPLIGFLPFLLYFGRRNKFKRNFWDYFDRLYLYSSLKRIDEIVKKFELSKNLSTYRNPFKRKYTKEAAKEKIKECLEEIVKECDRIKKEFKDYKEIERIRSIYLKYLSSP